MKLAPWLKTIKHRLLLMSHALYGPVRYEDAVAEAMAGIAGRWHGEIDPVYSYLAMLDVLKQAGVTGDGLEIGGGYSTVLLCQLVDRNAMRIESIDMNPDKYLRIIPRASTRRYVFQRIRRIDKLSVSFAQVERAYIEILPARIAEYGHERFMAALAPFCKHDQTAENWCEVDTNPFWQLGERLLQLPLCKHERQFYSANTLLEGEGYCSELVARGRKFEFVFFDCGEYSSLAEWFLLESQIKLGGFALLHDIYYPKSIKNFLVAALISLSDSWEIVYHDKVSPQGALVARKVKL
jgi:hypothetical protein